MAYLSRFRPGHLLELRAIRHQRALRFSAGGGGKGLRIVPAHSSNRRSWKRWLTPLV